MLRMELRAGFDTRTATTLAFEAIRYPPMVNSIVNTEAGGGRSGSDVGRKIAALCR